MDIGRTIQQIKNRLAAVERSARLSHASIDNTSVQVRDGNGSLRGLVGMQADGTTAVNIVNGPPPQQPSPPIVASVLGGVTASWDGTFADGSPVPLDWARVEVHASATAVYTPTQDTLHGTIETAQGATVVVPCTNPVYVLLLARSTSGTASSASATVGPVGPSPVVASDVVDGIITTVKLADDAVTQAKIAAAAVGSTEIGAGAVLEEKLAANAVTTSKLADATITGLKLADQAVTGAKVAVAAINSAAIADSAITAQKIGDQAVIAGKLASQAVTAGTIAANAVTATEITSGAVTTAKLAAGAVTANELAANAVVAGKIAANAVTATTIAAGQVQTAALAADAVAAGKIAADAITARELAANSVTASEIAANSVTAAAVAAGAITTDKLTVTGGANLLTDPSFEGAYTAALIAGLSYASQDTTKGNGSPTSLKINAVSSPAASRSVQLTLLPTLPGEQLYLAADYYVSADWAGTEVDFQVRWETDTGTILSYGKATTTGPVREAWTRLSGTFTAPASATKARIWVESGNATAGTVWWDNAAVRPVVAGTQIQDGAITTAKVVAGAIQTAQLDTGSVNADKIASGAVTTAKLDALAVTADKIAANAITVGKLAVGAVDATALSATAITGKTITGGTVTGSLIQTASTGQRITINESSNNRIYVYDATNAVIGEFSGSGLHVKGTAGATLWVDPSAPLPQIRFDNASGTASAYLQMAEVNPGDANLQFVTGPFSADGYTDRVWRQYMGNDFAVIERIRRSSSTNNRGGRLNLRPDLAEVGYQDANTVQEPGYTSYTPGTATHRARAVVQPVQASTTAPLLTLLQPSGHTALAVRYTDSGSVDRFTVDTAGNTAVGGTLSAGATTVTGTLSVTSTTWTSWTPTVSGAGTATFSITDGWYYKLGKLVFVQAYITCSAAGSGTGTVTVVLPSTPYRGPSANRRQHLSTYFGGLAAGTNSSTSGHGAGLIQPTGSGALIDQMRGPTDILVRGENLSATATIAINGWYREA
ncbi:hypothetical protein HUT11_35195 (plasmid) [Streptomyces seoulensis]|nr:hypothetical protein HUT11_35195 [Streptomyces seoulensis]